jgi:hypothetical protein
MRKTMSEGKKNEGKWAPWYIYAVLIAGVNLAKQELIADVVPVWVNAVATVVLVGAILLVVTVVYRSMSKAGQRR